MSKKLVKTAKQQFEERLKELTLLTSYQGLKDERLYLCENDHKEMSILRDSNEHGFIEYKYQGSYQSMVDSEEFLYKMVCRFNEIGEPVKYIFDWYASADKDLTPFTVCDIWQCMEYLTQLVFEDLYEEILTDKEQWEEDVKDVEKVSLEGSAFENVEGAEMRVESTDKYLKIYLFDGIFYHCHIYPPLDYLRKDADFLSSMKECILEFNPVPDEFLKQLDDWTSGKVEQFPLSFPSIYASGYNVYSIVSYADGEKCSEHPSDVSGVIKFVNMDDLKSLKHKVIRKIRMLYDMGYVVDTQKVKIDSFVAYVDGSGSSIEGYDIGIYEGKDGKLGLDFNGTTEWLDLKKAQRLKYEYVLGDIDKVCIEHLRAILQAMVLPE